MAKKHELLAKVIATPCYGIFADYDRNAPDTETFFYVATEELACEVCGVLNENPRAWSRLAYVEGYEHCKQFDFREELVREENAGTIFTSLEDVQNSEYFEKDDDTEDEE